MMGNLDLVRSFFGKDSKQAAPRVHIRILVVFALCISVLAPTSWSISPASATTSLGNASDVTINRAAYRNDSATVLNSYLPSGDSLTISGFAAETIRITVTTSVGTVNITSSSGLSLVTGSGYANSSVITAAGTTIAFQGSTTNAQAALNTLRLNLPTNLSNGASNTAVITVSVSFAGSQQVAFNADNGNYYILYPSNRTWQASMDLTTASSNCGVSFNGLCGYLATVTSAAESTFITNNVTTSQSWIGGNDITTEGSWRWPANAPTAEANKIFFKDSANNPAGSFCSDGTTGACTATGVDPVINYNNWNGSEPNDSAGEDALQLLSGGTGKWNDLPSNSSLLPYIVEFGGKGESVTYPSRTRNVRVAYSYSTGNSPPSITNNSSLASNSLSRAENLTSVETFTATDPGGLSLTWSISGGSDSSKFAIGSSNGVLTFVSALDFDSPTDSDLNNQYVAVVQVSNGSTTDSQTVTVSITNVNEAPTITIASSNPTHTISQAENISSVLTYTGSDVDAGTTLTWSISGTDAADFSINSTSGALAFAANPDFEAPADADTNNAYIVVVTVSDGSLTDTQTVTITITNANESASINAPTVSGTINKGINTTITVTINVAGKVRFFVGSKRISTCKDRTTSGTYPNNSATCTWKPAVTGRQYLTATLTPTDNTFSSSTSARTEVFVLKRGTTR
jgi:VCBS repeat-containing protein